MSPECSEDDVRECIEGNYLGALEDHKILDDECKFIVINSANEDSKTRNRYYNVEVKNSLEAIKALKTQFDQFDYLCFSNSVPGEVEILCNSIDEIHFNKLKS